MLITKREIKQDFGRPPASKWDRSITLTIPKGTPTRTLLNGNGAILHVVADVSIFKAPKDSMLEHDLKYRYVFIEIEDLEEDHPDPQDRR